MPCGRCAQDDRQKSRSPDSDTWWGTLEVLSRATRQLGARDGSVEQLHVVHHRQRMSRFIQHCPDLQLASRIACGHRLSWRRDNLLRLALAQLVGCLLLHQPVETCRATAERGLRKLQ